MPSPSATGWYSCPASAHAGTSEHTIAPKALCSIAAAASTVPDAVPGLLGAVTKWVFGHGADSLPSIGRVFAVPPMYGTPCWDRYSTVAVSAAESSITTPTTPSLSTSSRAAATAPSPVLSSSATAISTGWPPTPPCSVFTHSAHALATSSTVL